MPKVKNATSYFENGLKNRFRAIAIRADEHFPVPRPINLSNCRKYEEKNPEHFLKNLSNNVDQKYALSFPFSFSHFGFQVFLRITQKSINKLFRYQILFLEVDVNDWEISYWQSQYCFSFFFSTFDVKIHFVVETKARKLKVELSLSAKIRNLNLEDNQRATFLCVRGFQKIPSSFFSFLLFLFFLFFLSISFLTFSLLIFSFLLYWGENWIGENISKVHPHIV